MIDHSIGARAYIDINPNGPMAHDLPHRYLPLTGFDRRYVDGQFQDDGGQTCQFTAGRQRCQGTRQEHYNKWPEFYLLDQEDQHLEADYEDRYGPGE